MKASRTSGSRRSTVVPCPWRATTRPFSSSSFTDSRMTERLTLKSWQSTGSGGSEEPTG